MKFPKPSIVSFREAVPEVPSTSYLTHSLYYHPAKFIPQIVRYCLNEYCTTNGVVLDPFAGSGTVGLESLTQGYKSYLLDINPLLEFFYPLKMPSIKRDEWEKNYIEAERFLIQILAKEPKKIGRINNNIDYWYPEELYDYFCKVWTNFHQQKNRKSALARSTVALVLFKISKYFSYAEHSMPKLFISKQKRSFIDNKLLKDSPLDEIEKSAFNCLRDIKKSVDNLVKTNTSFKEVKYFAGVDSSEFDFKKVSKLDCIITSPPYLQAQEYIRTFKLEMMWIGIPQEDIKYYMSKEIPFRKAPGRMEGKYIDSTRSKIDRKDLTKLYDSYFWFMLKVLENSSMRLKKNGKLCVLIGNPKMNGIQVEIWKVIYEHFCDLLGFKFVELFEDTIVTRKLFSGRNNQNPNGMRSEYLLVLEKR